VWQEEILADIRQTVEREQREIEGKPDPEDVADFGFFYPYDYVRTMATVIESSNWSCLPDEGGLNDQDMLLIEDVLTYLHIKRVLRNQHTRTDDYLFDDGDGIEWPHGV